MFFQCSIEPITLDLNILKKFIKSCHWQYLRKYNLFGHHNLGWGFAYVPEQFNDKLVIKRDISPIYYSDWKNLSNIKTRFLLVHARKAKPWNKNFNDIHPINIHEKYVITHNGIIKDFLDDKLVNPNLDKIKSNTRLDTRKYICYIIDKIQNNTTLKTAIEDTFKSVKIGAGANAFLFNANECHVITYHNTNFNGRHHTLFISKDDTTIFVSTTPIKENAKEIENKSLISIDLKNLSIKFSSLTV